WRSTTHAPPVGGGKGGGSFSSLSSLLSVTCVTGDARDVTGDARDVTGDARDVTVASRDVTVTSRDVTVTSLPATVLPSHVSAACLRARSRRIRSALVDPCRRSHPSIRTLPSGSRSRRPTSGSHSRSIDRAM